MPKNKKISETEYKAFLDEIKTKIYAFQALFGEEALNIEHVADQYEKLCFTNDLSPKAPQKEKKGSDIL